MEEKKRIVRKDIRGRSVTIATATPTTSEKKIQSAVKKNAARIMKNVPPPEGKKLEEWRLFKNGDKPDVEVLQDHLFREGEQRFAPISFHIGSMFCRQVVWRLKQHFL